MSSWILSISSAQSDRRVETHRLLNDPVGVAQSDQVGEHRHTVLEDNGLGGRAVLDSVRLTGCVIFKSCWVWLRKNESTLRNRLGICFTAETEEAMRQRSAGHEQFRQGFLDVLLAHQQVAVRNIFRGEDC
jgi:hydroxyethylthiazole kinase-like sugar kinase family protein